MSTLVPLLQTQDPELLSVLSRIGPVVLKPSLIPTRSSDLSYYVLADHEASLDLDQLISWLDHGAEKIIVPMSWAQELVGIIPPERLLLLLDLNNGNFNAISDRIRSAVSGILLKTPSLDFDLIDSFSHFFAGQEVHIYPTNGAAPSIPAIRTLAGSGTKLVLPQSNLTLTTSSNTQISVTDAFVATLNTDRPDGLFATVVSSYPQSGRSLGLVYSSAASIRESILTGKGVYHSRKHGLWRKGETSGDTQTLVRVRVDCDSDALEFSVIQHGDGFCHLKRPSCFGKLNGLAALESTLQARLREAPEGSYTKRLFDDRELLSSKIMEEAEELCQAQTKDEIAFEAADLIYFALTRCVASGVGIADIERSLDRKARKISRRAGDAKPKWKKDAGQDNAAATPPPVKSPAPVQILVVNEPIRMRTYDLTAVSTSEYSQLLRRPVLKSDEMIQKVKPIVDTVRQKGDAALLEFAAKFDKATLTSTVVRPPFAPEAMEIPADVRDAIDIAYRNIRTFHEAQLDKAPLVVETMPGVVCTRFARPIARVGLYVPGGTAVLPSTALMLGVPAQVAGCREIVLATPPRPDGSISPEVMYVAHLVGASAVLKAGGGQAVAAMAYGTETVPKVDKIFGPGNQWVTAAKMLVQNDTDALVSIDMPAGPSEVLVIADHTSKPSFVAADLLSQAEHGIDSQVVLVAVALSDGHLAEIEREVDRQAHALPRVEILRKAVAQSIIVRAPDLESGINFSNEYAPEHLILHLEDAPTHVASIQNAGSVFVGPYTPESCGDYASGTNHTLPTNGYARQFSGVNTLSFQKHITSQEITPEGLARLGPVVATLADCEGLGAHANAVRIRLSEYGKQI